MVIRRSQRDGLAVLLAFAFTIVPTTSFLPPNPHHLCSTKCSTSLFHQTSHVSDDTSNDHVIPQPKPTPVVRNLIHSIAVASTILSIGLTPNLAFADEYGVEKEAPTLFTGESIMICVKRGPLGACQKTEQRTSDNDNDKAAQYFRNPGKEVIDKDLAMRNSFQGEAESELITRLKQQTSDNKERNAQIVRMKSLENDQSANFGPFDRQVVILNEDGKTFTLLENPQAMRLKKMGYIKDRKFIKQPTKEVIEQALESEDSGFGEIFKELFGDSK